MHKMKSKFHNEEKKDLFKSWLVLSLAFAILLTGRTFSFILLINFIISALTVGFGFVLHELAHKFLAEKYNCNAVFKAEPTMLAITLISSLFGFIFAAPGAVHIVGLISKKRRGHISLAGPLTNLILALLFIPIIILSQNDLISSIGTIGFQINAWIGLFNLIPFGFFDGKKIYNWNKLVWGLTTSLGIFFVFIFPKIL